MRILATLPTYNEARNILPLVEALLAISPCLEVLVIDDNSPDGTWKLVAEKCAAEPRVHLLHRTADRGRGTAGVAGFQKALDLGADLIVEMDADWSHHPRFLPRMLKATESADVVIGSRLVTGGGETGRRGIRKLITLAANLYIRILLRLPIRDCTSGYRIFRRPVLEGIDWSRVNSRGPALVKEILVAAKAQNATFAEDPILYEERRAGQSTFNLNILLAGLLAQWRFLFR